jgi:hypothetical protein
MSQRFYRIIGSNYMPSDLRVVGYFHFESRDCHGSKLFRLHQDSSYTSNIPGDGGWRNGSAVERRGLGYPLGSLRAAEGGKSGMTKIEDWPTWLQWAVAVPNAVILLALLRWTPKTKKGWYIAGSLLAIEAIFFIFFQNWSSK